MSTVFEHRDVDGDTFRVSEWQRPGVLSFEVDPDNDSTFVNMTRDNVLSLIQVLTEWAYPAHTPEGPNRSLIEELIAKAAKNAVSAVLPLHLSPVGVPRIVTECHRTGTHESDILCHECKPVAGHRPQECPGVGQCPEADPEPGDVGHPRPPLPLRKKTVIVPVCGLCKRPWSDGHGQPGDPCPGVEAARQHPSDWTDALWRVKPEPAGEARYCDECGHSWESYRPELGQCASIKGKAICGCTRRPA